MRDEQGGSEPTQSTWVDPDPFALANLMIAAAALVLQFIQTVQTNPSSPAAPAKPARNISHVEAALEDAQFELTRAVRSIERGARDADTEFYDRPTRIGATRLELPPDSYDQYGQALTASFGKVGALSLWVASLIRREPHVAGIIGAEMMREVGDSAERLNRILAEGRPIREVVQEANMVLLTTKEIIAKLANDRSN